MSEKGNQVAASITEQSVQITQKSYKDESIQRVPSNNDVSIQYENRVKFEELAE